MRISKIASIAIAGGIVLTLAGCGSGSSSSSTTTTTPTEQTQPETQLATVEGTVPADIELADGADLRAISGVKDVGAICTDGTTIDGYFKEENGQTIFVVDIPTDKECSIVFIDRAQTEGESLPEDATVLAATPAIKPESSTVTLNITAINNGVASIEAKGAVEVNTISPDTLVNKPLSEAVNEVKQEAQEETMTEETTAQENATQTTAEENATQTTEEVGKAVGNVDTGWLDKRAVGYGVDKIYRNVFGTGTSYKTIKATAKVGNILYLLENSGSQSNIQAVDLTTGQKVDWEVKDTTGATKTIGTDFDINATLVSGNIAWLSSNGTLKALKLPSEITNNKLEITLLTTSQNVSASALTTTNFETKDNYLIDKNGKVQNGQRWIFWYDEGSNSIKTANIQGTFFYNSYLGNMDYVLYSPTNNSVLNDGTTQSDKLVYASFDDSTNKFTIKASTNSISTVLGNGLSVNSNGIQYVGPFNSMYVFEAVDANSSGTQRLDLLSFNPSDGSVNVATVHTNANNDTNTSIKFANLSTTTNKQTSITDDGWVMGAVDINTSADFNNTLYIAQLTSSGTLQSGTNMTTSLNTKGSTAVTDIKEIVPFNSTLRFVVTNNGVGYVAGVAAGNLTLDGNVSGDLSTDFPQNTNSIYLGMADKDNYLIYADNNATTNGVERLHFNTATWTWENNKNGGAKSDTNGNIPANITNAKIINKDHLYVYTSSGNVTKINYDATNQNLKAEKYNNTVANIRSINNFNTNNWFDIYRTSVAASTTENVFKLEENGSDIPYYDMVSILSMPSNDNNVTLSTDRKYLLINTNAGNTDIIALNTADNTDATKVSQFLKDKNVSNVYTIGDNIYAVDSNNNLYVIPYNEDQTATISPVGNFVGGVNDIVANSDGNRIYVAVGNNNFIKVIDGSGNQIQSLQVFVQLPNGVDEQTALKNLKLAYAGDYVYVLGVVDNGNVIVPGANTTTTKDFGYLKVYKVNEDGTLTSVKDIKLFEYSDNNTSNVSTYFAKVVGEDDNAKLYIAYKNAESGAVAEQYNLANAADPQKEGSVQLVTTLGGVTASYAFSSQYIAAYGNTSVQLYKLPGLAAQPAVTLPNEFVGGTNNVFAFGNYLFIENNQRVAIIDVSDTQNPRLAGDVDLGKLGNNVKVNDLSVKVFGDKTYLVVGQAGSSASQVGGVTEIDLNSLQLNQ